MSLALAVSPDPQARLACETQRPLVARASLVVPWLRLTWQCRKHGSVLVWGDVMGRAAAAAEPLLPGARSPRREKPPSEKPVRSNWRKPACSKEDPPSQKEKIKFFKT